MCVTMKDERLKGVNIGGWLLMEGYLLGGRNIPEQEFKDRFKKFQQKRNRDLMSKCYLYYLQVEKVDGYMKPLVISKLDTTVIEKALL